MLHWTFSVTFLATHHLSARSSSKHVFVPNFAKVKRTAIAITPENEMHLRTGYEARTEKELPVLSRWFPRENVGDPGEAAFLDVILYSREQIRKEAS